MFFRSSLQGINTVSLLAISVARRFPALFVSVRLDSARSPAFRGPGAARADNPRKSQFVQTQSEQPNQPDPPKLNGLGRIPGVGPPANAEGRNLVDAHRSGHSTLEQENTEQGMSNFEGPDTSGGKNRHKRCYQLTYRALLDVWCRCFSSVFATFPGHFTALLSRSVVQSAGRIVSLISAWRVGC
jgi:hypothetical protein